LTGFVDGDIVEIVVILVTLFVLLSLPCNSIAEIYRYIDKTGVRWYSNVMPVDAGVSESSRDNKFSNPAKVDRHLAIYHAFVEKSAYKYSVHPSLIKAIISVESNWDPHAVSRKGAMGLMQIMPATAHSLGLQDPYNPKENIQAGTRHFRSLLEQFKGNLALALAAYNAGPTAVKRFGRIPPIKETETYVAKVLSRFGYDGSTVSSWQYNSADEIKAVKKADGSIFYTNLY